MRVSTDVLFQELKIFKRDLFKELKEFDIGNQVTSSSIEGAKRVIRFTLF